MSQAGTSASGSMQPPASPARKTKFVPRRRPNGPSSRRSMSTTPGPSIPPSNQSDRSSVGPSTGSKAAQNVQEGDSNTNNNIRRLETMPEDNEDSFTETPGSSFVPSDPSKRPAAAADAFAPRDPSSPQAEQQRVDENPQQEEHGGEHQSPNASTSSTLPIPLRGPAYEPRTSNVRGGRSETPEERTTYGPFSRLPAIPGRSPKRPVRRVQPAAKPTSRRANDDGSGSDRDDDERARVDAAKALLSGKELFRPPMSSSSSSSSSSDDSSIEGDDRYVDPRAEARNKNKRKAKRAAAAPPAAAKKVKKAAAPKTLSKKAQGKQRAVSRDRNEEENEDESEETPAARPASKKRARAAKEPKQKAAPRKRKAAPAPARDADDDGNDDDEEQEDAGAGQASANGQLVPATANPSQSDSTSQRRPRRNYARLISKLAVEPGLTKMAELASPRDIFEGRESQKLPKVKDAYKNHVQDRTRRNLVFHARIEAERRGIKVTTDEEALAVIGADADKSQARKDRIGSSVPLPGTPQKKVDGLEAAGGASSSQAGGHRRLGDKANSEVGSQNSDDEELPSSAAVGRMTQAQLSRIAAPRAVVAGPGTSASQMSFAAFGQANGGASDAEDEGLPREGGGGSDDGGEEDHFEDFGHVPQVLFTEGGMSLDQSTLTYNRPSGLGALENRPVVEEDHSIRFSNSNSFGRRPRSAKWSEAETDQFYSYIAQYGTDFEMLAKLFPGRDRRQIKLKWQREDKINPQRITDAFKRREKINVDDWTHKTGRQVDFAGPIPEDPMDKINEMRAEAEKEGRLYGRQPEQPAKGKKRVKGAQGTDGNRQQLQIENNEHGVPQITFTQDGDGENGEEQEEEEEDDDDDDDEEVARRRAIAMRLAEEDD